MCFVLFGGWKAYPDNVRDAKRQAWVLILFNNRTMKSIVLEKAFLNPKFKVLIAISYCIFHRVN